jgi:outer membrane protein TolC
MTVRLRFIAGVVAMGAFSVPVAAQTSLVTPQQHQTVRQYDGPAVSLTMLIEQAQQTNPDLSALRAQVELARQRPAQERGLAPPMVEATIWQWPINTLNPANTNMYMFMLGQDLPGHGKRDRRAAVANQDIAMAESDVAIRAREVVNQIKHAYASLFIARKAIDVDLTSVELLRQIADASQARYTSGRISQQDVLKPVVELSKLHRDIIMFDEQANLATARINILLDRAPETPIGPLTNPREAMLLPATADLQRMAIDHQPELQRARVEIMRAEAELASVKQDYKPDYTVQGGYLLMPNQTDALLARVGISWPRAPWSRGKIDARVAEQAAAVTAANAHERAIENAVRLAVQEAYVRAQSAQQRAALLRTTVIPQTQQTFDVSRVAYQADRLDFQAVIDNERMLLDAQLDYFRAVSEFEQARADLERAVGSDLPADTVRLVGDVKDH